MTPQLQPETTPHMAMMQMLCGQWVANSISTLARLAIPDHLEAGPKSPATVASQAGLNAEALYRLMRAAASVGVLTENPDGTFANTPLSATLQTNARPSIRHFATFLTQEWHMMGYSRAVDSIRTGKPAVDGVYGMPIFEYFSRNPEVGKNFDDAMTAVSSYESAAVAEVCDLSGLKSIVDVAGGHGLLLSTILDRNPGLKGTLYEQQHVLEGAKSGPLQPFGARASYAAGNMFETVPAGADAYIMKYIIHDWPDDVCIKILKGCRAGVNPNGRLFVADNVIPTSNEFSFGKIIDIEMLLFPGGKERTEQQFRDLFAAAGWRLTRVFPTACPLSVVEAAPM